MTTEEVKDRKGISTQLSYGLYDVLLSGATVKLGVYCLKYNNFIDESFFGVYYKDQLIDSVGTEEEENANYIWEKLVQIYMEESMYGDPT